MKAAGFEVVGISADEQPVSEAFRKSLELPYPLVADPAGRILHAYEVRWPLLGLARRVSYWVGRDQRVIGSFSSELDPEAHVTQACRVALKEA